MKNSNHYKCHIIFKNSQNESCNKLTQKLPKEHGHLEQQNEACQYLACL